MAFGLLKTFLGFANIEVYRDLEYADSNPFHVKDSYQVSKIHCCCYFNSECCNI
jgi:hypothetical protein